MTTELTVTKRPSFLPAAASSSVMTEFMNGLQGTGGLDLPILSLRGKGFRLRRDGQEVSLKATMLDIILVGSRANNSRRFYEGAYVPGETTAPSCSSADGIKPDDNAQDKQSDTCAMCPHNQWGSRITVSGKKGKECDDYRRVLVFIPSKQIMKPVVLDIPATSLRKSKGDHGPELQLREYLLAMARHGIEPHQAVTTLSFSDDEYPRLTFSFARWANEDEYAAVEESRDSDEFKQALTFEEAEGPIVPDAEEVAKQNAPMKVPKKAKPAPEPEVEEDDEDEEEVEPAPKKKPAAKKATPKPEPEEVEEESDDDLDALLALLD